MVEKIENVRIETLVIAVQVIPVRMETVGILVGESRELIVFVSAFGTNRVLPNNFLVRKEIERLADKTGIVKVTRQIDPTFFVDSYNSDGDVHRVGGVLVLLDDLHLPRTGVSMIVMVDSSVTIVEN